jgi:hypothetical protein
VRDWWAELLAYGVIAYSLVLFVFGLIDWIDELISRGSEK